MIDMWEKNMDNRSTKKLEDDLWLSDGDAFLFSEMRDLLTDRVNRRFLTHNSFSPFGDSGPNI